MVISLCNIFEIHWLNMGFSSPQMWSPSHTHCLTMKIFHTVTLSYNEQKKCFRFLKTQLIRKVRNTVKEIHTYRTLNRNKWLRVHSARGYKDEGKNLDSPLGVLLQVYRIPLRIFLLTTWKPQSDLLLLTKAFQGMLSHKQIRCDSAELPTHFSWGSA